MQVAGLVSLPCKKAAASGACYGLLVGQAQYVFHVGVCISHTSRAGLGLPTWKRPPNPGVPLQL